MSRHKLTTDQISQCDSDVFGLWMSDDSLPAAFQQASPFPHVVIDNFLAPAVAHSLHRQFPAYSPDTWWEYRNPIEVKYANDNIPNMPDIFQQVFCALASPSMVACMRRLTGIPDLNYDEYLHGAGLHLHPQNGRLMMHLDYEKHPFSGQERRLNIILHLSQGWDSAWNGDTELWNANMTECEVASPVIFNRAIIFRTNDISWHGVPKLIRCPEGTFRQTLAFYYVSPLTSEASSQKEGANLEGFRTKACFVRRPQDRPDAGLDALLAIRPHRRLTEDDVQHHCPDWTPENN